MEDPAGGGWVQPEGPNTLCSYHKVILLIPVLALERISALQLQSAQLSLKSRN